MHGNLSNMTSLYILRGDEVLMLYRRGSRALVRDSWVGVGGHFEEFELNDARACILREAEEEIGLLPDELADLELRYIAVRAKKKEISQNYYFFAHLKDEAREFDGCSEGDLHWMPLSEAVKLDMPYTAKYVVQHFAETGRFTSDLYVLTATEGGAEIVKAALFEK